MDAEKAFEAALALHKLGDLGAAESAYAELVAGDPPPDDSVKADALHMHGLIAFQNGDLDKATNLIRSALAIEDHVALYHRNLGRVCRAANMLQPALEAFDQAVALGLDDADVHTDRADALIGLGRFADAEEAAKQALNGSNGSGRAHLMLGLARLERGNLDGAGGPLNRAVQLNPENPAANHHRGRLLQAAGDLNGAAEHYIRAMTEVPDFVEAINNLGNVRRAQSRFLDAEAQVTYL